MGSSHTLSSATIVCQLIRPKDSASDTLFSLTQRPPTGPHYRRSHPVPTLSSTCILANFGN
eukprot:m.176064 g.176064  ORF g.176064 m.176064 type:complete len:61 (+) comp24426_c4_seq1:3023-3205(+)